MHCNTGEGESKNRAKPDIHAEPFFVFFAI